MRLGYPKKKTVLRGGWKNRWYFVYSGYDRSILALSSMNFQ